MQLSASFLALLATVVPGLVAPTDARPLRRNSGPMVTVPVRRVAISEHIHPEIRHQQQVNRAHRLAARVAGVNGPSDAELMESIERRAALVEKRYTAPPPVEDFDGTAVNVVENAAATSSSSNPSTNLATHSDTVLPDGADTQFIAQIPIGTPLRDFNIILDSGSSDFWIDSTNCTAQAGGGGCGNHNFVGSANSATFLDSRKPFSVQYGSGAASGVIVNDTVVLGGVMLKNLAFGAAQSISSSFSNDANTDGLMGLAKQSLSNMGVPTPVQALKSTGLIDEAITSFRLPRSLDNQNIGEVTFGGLDTTKFDTKTLVTVPSLNSGFWLINMDGVSVNGASINLSSAGNGKRTAIMDTGTTLMVVSATDVDPIHEQIPGAVKTGTGSWKVPCNTTASVALSFGGRSFAINSKDLPFASGGRTSGLCTSGIGAFSTGGNNPNQWLVGDTFLKSVYFSTNEDKDTVSLAEVLN